MFPDSANQTDTITRRDSFRAWLACWLGLIVLFAAFGMAYSFGVFLPALSDDFAIGRGSASIFFSFTTFLFFTLGIVTGPLSDRLGARLFIVIGGLLIAFGLWLTSIAHDLLQAYLAYGVGMGVGVSCIFIPVVAAVTRHFEKRRSLALGITVSGIGLGTLVMAPLSETLIATMGWRQTYQILAIVSAVLLILPGLIFPMPPRGTTQAKPAHNNVSGASLHVRYAYFYLATILINLAMYVPFSHLPAAAQANGIAAGQAARLLGLIGVASVVGRLLIGALGTRFDEWFIYRLCIACVAASFVLWGLAGGSYSVYILYAAVGGFGYGGYIALTPAVIAREFSSARIGYLMGLTYTAVAIGASVGPLAVGLLAQWLGSYPVPLFGLAAMTALGLIPMAVFPTEHVQHGIDPTDHD